MTTPEGWYASKQRPGQERFWDGQTWTNAFRPRSSAEEPAPAAPSAAPAARVDDSAAWLLVVLPLLSLGIVVTLLMSGFAIDDNLVTLGVVLASWAVVIWDGRLLSKAGATGTPSALAFVIPLYLFQRSRLLQASYIIPVVWIIAFVGYLVAATAAANHYGPFTLDMSRVESGIKANIDAAAGTSATVECPEKDTWMRGETFDCSVSDGNGSLMERVEVLAKGAVTWVGVPG